MRDHLCRGHKFARADSTTSVCVGGHSEFHSIPGRPVLSTYLRSNYTGKRLAATPAERQKPRHFRVSQSNPSPDPLIDPWHEFLLHALGGFWRAAFPMLLESFSLLRSRRPSKLPKCHRSLFHQWRCFCTQIDNRKESTNCLESS